MKIIKAILMVFAFIWLFNTFYAYCAATEKLEKENISKLLFYVFIILSLLGFVAAYLLIKIS